MGIAYDMGLAGENKLWLISGTADLAPFLLSGKFIIPKDSSAAKAISGNGIIFCKGGLPGKSLVLFYRMNACVQCEVFEI